MSKNVLFIMSDQHQQRAVDAMVTILSKRQILML